jgi:CubicO group peptidase (beta-lactamase class C family)
MRSVVPQLLVVAALLSPGRALGAQTPATLSTGPLEGMIRPLVVRNDFAGAVAVAQNGRILFTNSWGKADLAAPRAHTAATRFHLGALSQQFTAVLILDLAADGFLTLDDPLARWLPGIRWAPAVTLRDLLGHRAGLPRDFPTWPDGSERYTSDGDRYAWLSTLRATGGGEYAASDVGYWLLAQVAALAGESPFTALLRERLLETNGLRGIDVDDGSRPIPDLATGYEPTGIAGLTPALPRPLGGRLGSSGVVATIADLGAWTNALHAARIVPRPLVDAMIEGRWGLVDTTRGGRRGIGAAGSGAGFVASADWYPADRAVVLVLANTRTGAAEQLRDGVAAAIFGAPLPAIALPAAGPAPQEGWLADYVGAFTRPDGGRIVVARAASGLRLGAGSDPLTDLYPLGSEAFFQRATYARVEFVRDEGGKVKRLRWIRNGITLEFIRE